MGTGFNDGYPGTRADGCFYKNLHIYSLKAQTNHGTQPFALLLICHLFYLSDDTTILHIRTILFSASPIGAFKYTGHEEVLNKKRLRYIKNTVVDYIVHKNLHNILENH